MSNERMDQATYASFAQDPLTSCLQPSTGMPLGQLSQADAAAADAAAGAQAFEVMRPTLPNLSFTGTNVPGSS